MDEAKNDTVPLLSNGGPDVAISMDGVGGDKQRYQQQLQLIDEQVFLIIDTIIIRITIIVSIIIVIIQQNGTRSLSKAGIGRVCTRPAKTRATKEKMAQCSQERLR